MINSHSLFGRKVFSGYSFEDIHFLKSAIQNNFSENHYILFGVNKLDNQREDSTTA